MFTYGDAPAGATPATKVDIAFSPAAAVSWTWDGQAWRRSQGGRPFTVTGGGRIGPGNLVVQFVDVRDSGQTDPAGHGVPVSTLVGTGDAIVFRNGQQISGTWSKTDRTSRTSYTTANGEAITLGPGRTWVELVPRGQSVTAR